MLLHASRMGQSRLAIFQIWSDSKQLETSDVPPNRIHRLLCKPTKVGLHGKNKTTSINEPKG